LADFLGIKSNADQETINKAFKKKSKQLHPDIVSRQFRASQDTKKSKPKSGKKPGVNVSKGPSQSEVRAVMKKASDRYARLGVAKDILKGPGRERYDHFLKNGFPRWKGTGYYYARFRPGLFSVLFGLFVVCGGGAHYGAMYLSWKRQRDFVGRYIRHARRAAWGDELGIKGIFGVDGVGTAAPPPSQEDVSMQGLNRRQRRMQEKDNKRAKSSKGSNDASTPEVEPASTRPQGDKKKVIAENGKVLIVDSAGSVYLEEENDDGETEIFLLDVSMTMGKTIQILMTFQVDEIPKPTVQQTMLFRLPVWGYKKTIGRLLGSETEEAEPAGAESSSNSDADTEDVSTAKRTARRRNKRNGKAR
jgi:curved DNA-binding protein CbpA